MELRNIELRPLDFDHRLLHIVQSKGNKDRYVPLSNHLIRGIQKYISAGQPKKYLFEENSWKRGRLQDLQKELQVYQPVPKQKTMLWKCPCCKTGTLITIEIFGKRCPLKLSLSVTKFVPVK